RIDIILTYVIKIVCETFSMDYLKAKACYFTEEVFYTNAHWHIELSQFVIRAIWIFRKSPSFGMQWLQFNPITGKRIATHWFELKHTYSDQSIRTKLMPD